MNGCTLNWKIISMLITASYWVIFFTLSWMIVYHEAVKLPLSENVYQNLHAMQYPTTTSDLTLFTIQTPGFPIRLSSAWEIQNDLKIVSNPRLSTDAMIYPLMEGTKDMNQLLSQQASTNTNKYCAACYAQDVYSFKNKLVESQKYQFCPQRGENKTSWFSRTKQTKEDDQRNLNFTLYSEHAEFCRKKRLPSMVLAHVSANSFSLFSSQNSETLLLFFTTVNAFFSFSVAIYKAWASCIPIDMNADKRLNVGGQFSVLFVTVAMLCILPIFLDFLMGVRGNLAYYKSQGSYVAGIWTIIFSFVYLYVIPRLNVMLNDPDSDKESNSFGSIPVERKAKDPFIIKYFVSRQPMISLAYWNFMQAPVIVLTVISKRTYGIDVYMQFVVFVTIAACVLDIIHTRVSMIMGLRRRVCNENDGTSLKIQPTGLDVFIYFAFLAMNLVLSVPIFMKFTQENVHSQGICATVLVLYSQLLQKGFALAMRFIRHNRNNKANSANENTTNQSSNEEQKTFLHVQNVLTEKNKNELYGGDLDNEFECSLIWHMSVSVSVLGLIMSMHTTSA